MKLYLMQHGEALSKQDNVDRPLSDKGKGDVQRVASFLASAKIRIDRIIHSGKTRVEQTASLISAGLTTPSKLEQSNFINPNDDVEAFIRHLAQEAGDVMVVGHLPFVDRLVAYLSVGDSSKSVVAYQPGSIVCLEYVDDNDWNICWMLRPELV